MIFTKKKKKKLTDSVSLLFSSFPQHLAVCRHIFWGPSWSVSIEIHVIIASIKYATETKENQPDYSLGMFRCSTRLLTYEVLSSFFNCLQTIFKIILNYSIIIKQAGEKKIILSFKIARNNNVHFHLFWISNWTSVIKTDLDQSVQPMLWRISVEVFAQFWPIWQDFLP